MGSEVELGKQLIISQLTPSRVCGALPGPGGEHMGEYRPPWPCWGFSLSTPFLNSFVHWAPT